MAKNMAEKTGGDSQFASANRSYPVNKANHTSANTGIGTMKTCSKCGKRSKSAYCPGCGKKM